MKHRINKYLTPILVLSLSMAILVGLIIVPAFNYILKINQEISFERSELEKKMAISLNAKKIKEEVATAESMMPQIEKIFVKKGNELSIITEVESLATKRKIDATVKSDFKTQAAGNGAQKMILEIKATGKYQELLAFINDLDSLNYYYNIDSTSIYKVNDKEQELASIDLSGQIYIK